MLPEKELTSSQRLSLSAALVWPAIDISQAQQARPAGSFVGGFVSGARGPANYATLLNETYEHFPGKALIDDLYRLLRSDAQTQALRQQLQPHRQSPEQRYSAIADLLEKLLTSEQAGAFKELMLAVGRSAAGASVEEPERDLLRRMAGALRLGPGGRQGSLSASQPEENDVIETTRRRPAGPTPPGARPTAQRPQRRRQGG